MKIRTTLLCAGAILFAGCGNGEDQPPEERSGVFQAGRVSGLRYVTSTRSGLTDADGTFKYLAGESVTFSVGAMELGHAPGASRITPFTLAGMTPPTTEVALRRELDRASRTTSNFVRATNLMRLLLALDADHDPANGLDLRGRDTALANATLDFDQTIPQFAISLEKLAPDLTHNMPRWLPIVHLYRALGIAVPAHVPVDQVYDYGGLSLPGTRFSYYPDGSLESRGSYDALTPFNSSYVYTYDGLGRTISTRSEQDSSVFGGYIQEEILTYDARGSFSTRTTEFDQGGDGSIDVRQFTEIETDAFANTLGEVTRSDSGNDGTIDRVETLEAHFDARRNPDISIWQTDSNLDGVTDSRTTIDYEFDAANRLVATRYETDDPADGILDSLYSISSTYAGRGPDVVEVYEDDSDADGTPDSRVTYDWVHDSNGSLRTLTIEYEYELGDPAIGSETLNVITFDRDRRVATEVSSEDWDGDGVANHVSRRTNSYGAHGNKLEEVLEWVSGDGTAWDSRYVTRYEYGAGGELLGYERTDQSPGAEPSVNSSMRVTNTPVENGVLTLSQAYLEFSYLTGAVAGL
jgi:hypothetical protein